MSAKLQLDTASMLFAQIQVCNAKYNKPQTRRLLMTTLFYGRGSQLTYRLLNIFEQEVDAWILFSQK